MKRSELEHLIRAAADIADDDEMIVIKPGDTRTTTPLPDLCVLTEADMYPRTGQARGPHRPFDRRRLAISRHVRLLRRASAGRRRRCRPGGRTGSSSSQREYARDGVVSRRATWCSLKYVAGREGRPLVRAALAGKLMSAETLIERLSAMPIDDSARERIERRIAADKVRGSS
jgi:hypothetical protein